MADSIPWFKAIQSVGRGFRSGMEVHTITDGKDTGKTIVFDYESDDFKPWRETFCPHYAEYRDFDTGETYWKKFNRLPKSADMYRANNIIRKNEDSTYEYVKNRETGELRQLTEEETMWLILKAG
jgi:hypothetical protein